LAIDKLPGTVTLAFNPYAPDLFEQVGQSARRFNMKVVLEVPIGAGSTTTREIPDHTHCSPGLTARQNLDRLEWSLSRAVGYVGSPT